MDVAVLEQETFVVRLRIISLIKLSPKVAGWEHLALLFARVAMRLALHRRVSPVTQTTDNTTVVGKSFGNGLSYCCIDTDVAKSVPRPVPNI